MDRDKTRLGITWLKDKSLADLYDQPDPDVLALDIPENRDAGLENLKLIINSWIDLGCWIEWL